MPDAAIISAGASLTGAALGAGVVILNQRAQRVEARRGRLYESRRVAYADYLAACSTLADLVERAWQHRLARRPVPPGHVFDTQSLYAVVAERLDPPAATIELLGAPGLSNLLRSTRSLLGARLGMLDEWDRGAGQERLAEDVRENDVLLRKAFTALRDVLRRDLSP